MKFSPTHQDPTVKHQVDKILNDPSYILKKMEENRGFCNWGLQKTLRNRNIDAKCLRRSKMQTAKYGIDWDM